MINTQPPATAVPELRSLLLRWTVVLALVGLFALWATWRLASTAARQPTGGAPQTHAAAPSEPAIEYWTCTMHPQVRQPGPGECPICGMELVPKYVGSDQPGIAPPRASPPQHAEHAPATQAQTRPREWYQCTMPECGDQGSSDPDSRCPVCGMKRERVETFGDSAAGDVDLRLSERARRLAEIETQPVQPRTLLKRIRTVGRVSYDETRYRMVSAWTGGRIDNLFADFTGMTVSKGDHLVEIYSPELLSAQEEYLQALRSAAAGRSAPFEAARRSSEQLLEAATRKLQLLGVTDEQIAAIERSGQPQTHLVVHAPIGGTIVKKMATEGMYVKTGDELYTIADLTHVWLLVDLYESDLPWVRPFQKVTVTARPLPGEAFTGQIVFVEPTLNPTTRTVQVRIHVANPDLRLKPEMWVSAQIEVPLAAGGRGAVPAPAGTFVCPMHPWEAADAPGRCPVCEMSLVAAADLPQYAAATEPVPVLSVPREAVMQTGERALVYVESAPATYRGVEVIVGPLAQDETGREYYPILAGLRGDERVVMRGNFAIDSQMQLAGKPSLFSARGIGGDSHGGHGGGHSSAAPLEAAGPSAAPPAGERTRCPVMGGEIDQAVFSDLLGERVYFCCPPCVAKFEADPEKYIAVLPLAFQQKLRRPHTKETGHD